MPKFRFQSLICPFVSVRLACDNLGDDSVWQRLNLKTNNVIARRPALRGDVAISIHKISIRLHSPLQSIDEIVPLNYSIKVCGITQGVAPPTASDRNDNS